MQELACASIIDVYNKNRHANIKKPHVQYRLLLRVDRW